MTDRRYLRDDFRKVNRYYVTAGIRESLPIELVCLMLVLIDDMDCRERDAFQFFKLCKNPDGFALRHEQENPDFSETVNLIGIGEELREMTVYVIAEDDHCTVLLSSEY